MGQVESKLKILFGVRPCIGNVGMCVIVISLCLFAWLNLINKSALSQFVFILYCFKNSDEKSNVTFYLKKLKISY